MLCTFYCINQKGHNVGPTFNNVKTLRGFSRVPDPASTKLPIHLPLNGFHNYWRFYQASYKVENFLIPSLFLHVLVGIPSCGWLFHHRLFGHSEIRFEKEKQDTFFSLAFVCRLSEYSELGALETFTGSYQWTALFGTVWGSRQKDILSCTTNP